MRKKTSIHLCFLIMLCACSLGVQAFTITTFAPTVYNANTAIMDATLGIDASYTIENFEDLTFVSGLTITYDNVIGGHHLQGSGPWDGATELGTYLNNYSSFPTFSFSTGLTSFGVGINNMAGTGYPAYMYVNGVSFGMVQQMPNYAVTTRNIYIRIDAVGSERINSVKFTTSSGDYVGFDHLAMQVSSVPEMSTVYTLLLAGVFFLIVKK